MSDAPQVTAAVTPAQKAAEVAMLDAADDLLKSAAATGPAEDEFATVEGDRFEARVDVPEEEEKDEEVDTPETTSRGTWHDQPSIKDQAQQVPDSVRIVEPHSVVLDLHDSEQLAELNRLQKASAEEPPKLSITEYDRQFHEGKWSVYLTYCKVQYQKL